MRARYGSDFIKLLTAVSFSTLGDGLTLLALPWLTSSLTSNTFLVSLVSASMVLPWLLFSLHVGVLIDSVSRKKLLIYSIISRIVLLIILILIILTNKVSIPLLILIAFGLGITKVVYDSTSQTVVPNLVKAEHLEKANGYVMTSRLTMSDVLGRALGGMIIPIGIMLPFTVDLILLIITLPFILLIKAGLKVKQTNERARISEGISFVLTNPMLKYLSFLGVGITLMFSATLSIQVFFVREILNLDSFGFGILISVSTIGSIIGSQTISFIKNRWGFEKTILISLLIMGLTFGAVGFANNSYFVMIMYFIGSYFIVIWNVSNLSFRQKVTPNEKLGRVGSVIRLLSWGMNPIGMLFGGSLVTFFEPIIGREFALRIPNILLGVIFICLTMVLYRLINNLNKNEGWNNLKSESNL
ncbi:MFS transporter [Bacillus sp. 'calajunan']|uniref:MFS transporter n=1 Tax=Bacillus sp. 'calajunan' TaxID=3447457 RepID=UPI003EE052D4